MGLNTAVQKVLQSLHKTKEMSVFASFHRTAVLTNLHKQKQHRSAKHFLHPYEPLPTWGKKAAVLNSDRCVAFSCLNIKGQVKFYGADLAKLPTFILFPKLLSSLQKFLQQQLFCIMISEMLSPLMRSQTF